MSEESSKPSGKVAIMDAKQITEVLQQTREGQSLLVLFEPLADPKTNEVKAPSPLVGQVVKKSWDGEKPHLLISVAFIKGEELHYHYCQTTPCWQNQEKKTVLSVKVLS